MPTACDTYLLGLNGATGLDGAGGAATLAILGLHPLDEASGATADDLANITDGSYLGSPAGFRANSSHLYNNTTATYETGGGYGIALDGTNDCVDMGDASGLYTAMKTNGLTIIAAITHTASAGLDTIYGFRLNSAGLLIAFNGNGVGNFAGAGVKTLEVLLSTHGFTGYADRLFTPTGTGHEPFHCGSRDIYEFYVKCINNTTQASQIIRVYRNGILLTGAVASGSGTLLHSDFPRAGSAKSAIGSMFNGTTIDNSFAGAMTIGHVTRFHGELTAAQRIQYMKEASFVKDGIPIRHLVVDLTRPNSVWTHPTDPIFCSANRDPAYILKDFSGKAHHLAYDGTDVPKYLTTDNWGEPCVVLENLYQNYGADPIQHLFKKLDCEPMCSGAATVIFVGRIQATDKYQRTYQPIAGLYSAAEPGVPYGVLASYSQQSSTPAAQHESKIVRIQGSNPWSPNPASEADWPATRCLPGLVVCAFTVGHAGAMALGTPRMWMNRFVGNASAAITDGSTSTAIRIGGDGVSGDALGMIRIQEVYVTDALQDPDTQMTAFLAAAFARNNETMNPTRHMCIAWDSGGVGEHGTLGRSPFSYWPASAKANCSFVQASVQSASVAGSGVIDMAERGLATAGRWNDPSATTNILVFGAGGNDISGGQSGDAVWTETSTLLGTLTSRFNSITVLSVPEYFGSTESAEYNALAAASGYRYIPFPALTPYLFDSVHVGDDGQEIMGLTILNGMRDLFPSSGGGGRTRTRSRRR